jgi:hypothetical protein
VLRKFHKKGVKEKEKMLRKYKVSRFYLTNCCAVKLYWKDDKRKSIVFLCLSGLFRSETIMTSYTRMLEKLREICF